MKNSISFDDAASLSALLDGQLSQAQKTRLERRLVDQPELAGIMQELQVVKQILRKTPHRRAPRNFILTPRMAGLKPPVPRLVPAFSWASAVAMLLFIFTLGSNLVGRISTGMAARVESAPAGYGMGGGPPAAEGPYPEATAGDSNLDGTPTPDMMLMTLPEATDGAEERAMEPVVETAPKDPPSASPWLVTWLILAGVFVGGALLLRWISIRRFRQKTRE